MRVSVLAAWVDEDEQKEFIADAKRHGIEKAIFTEGSNYDSRWTFEGPEKSVKKFVENNFQIVQTFEPFDQLVKNVELQAIVDGVSMS